MEKKRKQMKDGRERAIVCEEEMMAEGGGNEDIHWSAPACGVDESHPSSRQSVPGLVARRRCATPSLTLAWHAYFTPAPLLLSCASQVPSLVLPSHIHDKEAISMLATCAEVANMCKLLQTRNAWIVKCQTHWQEGTPFECSKGWWWLWWWRGVVCWELVRLAPTPVQWLPPLVHTFRTYFYFLPA